MTITLEAIEAKHTELGQLIEQFKEQANGTEIRIHDAAIPLAVGERFAGIVLNEDGTPSHYLIKLPGEAVEVNFAAARDWAAQQGGELPTRTEQALLYANLKSEFSANWYWSGEERDDGFAWCQHFTGGDQYCDFQDYELRAVAVRRFKN
ncbi:DUF1566 domain-containing protein [Pandoraea sp. XJJ-1]|uniref:DUF1566 domain-containing protein n=1 Tax=Pandoraea sp. XJJ-1 TaxID=3002643 RepID=UPI002282ED13|nr:DUF1566 domain-containing protein [Pandoraea sp. XJJ-1]WAL80988.1 DUF1566 domain-containing protein [Pandoraea sp. XJJ-1]